MNNSPITWQTIVHTLVGMVIVGSQMTAGEFPNNASLVAYCHIIAAIVAQLGIGLGVWQVTTGVATRRALMASNCVNCGKPAFEQQPAPVPEAPKAAA